jgi:PAS domain S-box-containing protein
MQSDKPATREISAERLTDLESSELLLRVIADNVADLIAVVDSSGNRIWNNHAYAVRLGYRPEDLKGSNSMVEIHPDDIGLVRDTLAQSVREGRGRRIEYRMRRTDGAWINLESEGRVVQNWNGHERCLVVVSRDITARKLEERTREEHSQLRVKRAVALSDLISSPAMQNGELDRCFATAVRIVVELSTFARASVWTMDENEEVLTFRHRSGAQPAEVPPPFTKAGHEAFFTLLKSKRVIASRSLANDARLSGISRDFVADGVTGMLIIPLQRGCSVLGALICERFGQPRNWDYEEATFATHCGNAIVLAADTRERLDTYRRLQESQRQLAGELREAAIYVESLLPAPLRGELETDSRFIPSEALGGDAFGYHWLDQDHLAIYLLDVVGHGVRAALVSVAAMNHLRSASIAESDLRCPVKVLTALNRMFQMDEQDGMYFTLWYGIYHKSERQLRYASAGHPPALLFAPGCAKPVQLQTPGLMIGAMPDSEYQAASCTVEPSSTLYVISDGLYEIELESGATGTLNDLIENIFACPDGDLDHLVARARAMQCAGRTRFDDDISILKLRFS